MVPAEEGEGAGGALLGEDVGCRLDGAAVGTDGARGEGGASRTTGGSPVTAGTGRGLTDVAAGPREAGGEDGRGLTDVSATPVGPALCAAGGTST
ncbi:hypothetical protein OG689_43970 [Kitasatospora sp. NBC_00240]|uniref:hypothetical protein n=1 Tax=Kitasatospora sp. NBC_00240 TaxID=2903567 RepID=UPI002254508B|nr:hypothetical protein [Kitasatospora sp. NBC_00240]MCX5207756.1 hypothetical protein [Kitasatospora sp. NBC_00240]MCX5215345.1 hypothetical protein [Kitasatospora sp. NBC_00240]MCX5216094.1 hypothetical protein [Kitasatospora sp. NBC_00240]